MINPENDTHNINERFYRAFEDRFRGSREEIKSRLKLYLPFIQPLKKIYDVCSATDLGCGRGEWLEIITESGMLAHGVDLDDGMLAACRERNLSVETGDAISFLRSLPDQSQAIISGFHIIEHITFSDLRVLVQEAFRVLKPAGLLILETPNPENIVVSSTSFHLDPSHIKPIPPQLLAFLAEYYGFQKNKVLRLQETLNPPANKLPNLFHVLYGVSPDYSVVAQKQAAEEQLRLFDTAFDREYGLTLEKLAQSFDAQIARVLGDIQAELNNTRTELNNTRTELNNIYNSRSWRITAPLRKTADIGRDFLQNIRHPRILINRVAFVLLKIRWVVSLKNWIKRRFPRQWQSLASRFSISHPRANGQNLSHPFSLAQFSTEMSHFKAGHAEEINIDEIMEKIRTEVERVKAQKLQEETNK